MRPVSLVIALVLVVALAVPANAVTHPGEDQVLEILESQPHVGPYADPGG